MERGLTFPHWTLIVRQRMDRRPDGPGFILPKARGVAAQRIDLIHVIPKDFRESAAQVQNS